MSAQEEDFDFPILTVDGVVFQLTGDKLTVLLIRRGSEPFLGVWALPGVYISKEENSHRALERALVEKTGISTKQLELIEQPYAFDAPNRDPRGYAITVMYMGLGRGVVPGEHPDMNNGQSPTFVPIESLPELAYDHAAIVAFAYNRLKSLAASTNVVASFMPQTFTLFALQVAYEAIFSKKLDKRNFRKKIQQFVTPTGHMARDGAHRPAELYKFSHAKFTAASDF